MTDADLVWNRACGEERLRSLPGDRALADLLLAHGLIMNGGVLHAIECLAPGEIVAAESGFHFYGLDTAADLLAQGRQAWDTQDALDDWEQRLDREYYELITDEELAKRFERHFRASPSDYAPPREDNPANGPV